MKGVEENSSAPFCCQAEEELQLCHAMIATLRIPCLALLMLAGSSGVGHCEPDLTKAPIKWASIRRGHKGVLSAQDIQAIQYLLRSRGCYAEKPNGLFDVKTVEAVQAFQRKNGLKVDGILGPQTLPKLVPTLKRGARGDAVRAAQVLVRQVTNHIGELPNGKLAVDGVFGKETEQAVIAAQACLSFPEEKLKETGVMDKRTWCILLGGEVVYS